MLSSKLRRFRLKFFAIKSIPLLIFANRRISQIENKRFFDLTKNLAITKNYFWKNRKLVLMTNVTKLKIQKAFSFFAISVCNQMNTFQFYSKWLFLEACLFVLQLCQLLQPVYEYSFLILPLTLELNGTVRRPKCHS
jgi:hypothetical protein